MPRGTRSATVLHVTGPVVIDWGNGVRIQLSPAGLAPASPSAASGGARKAAGRPPSPATLKLREAMQADAQANRPRSRAAYLALLGEAGGPSSPNAAGIIVNREAKRAFGRPLGRGKGKARAGRRGGRKAGRQASPGTVALRTKLQADKANGGLRDAPHYVRWLVDQPGVKIGLKQARPVVYRELREAKRGAEP